MNYYYKNVDNLFLEGEIFKDISGYDGDYQISNYGRVKSFKKYRGKDVQILKQIEMNTGYLFVNLYKNGKGKPKKIHDLMFESFNNYKLKKGECVHHINENKLDNDLNNFQFMTNSEHCKLHMSGENNPKGMFGKKHSDETKELMREKKIGKYSGENNPMFGKTGENNPNVKLTEQNVIKIKKYLDEGILSQEEIAEMFGVNQSTISAIKTGKRWKNI